MNIIELNLHIENSDLERVKDIVENNIDLLEKEYLFDNTPLRNASRLGHFEIVKYLCEKYMQNPQFNISEQHRNGRTALHTPSQNGNLKIVKILCEAGIDMNIMNDFGKTALHFASYNGHLDIVKTLCEAGADIDIMDKKGKTALDLAKTEEIRNYLEGQSNSYVLK